MRHLVFLALACALPAQGGPDFDLLEKGLKYRLSDDGRIELSPDPMRGDGTGWCEISGIDRMDIVQQGGITAWLAMVFPGDTDIASLANTPVLFDKLGLGTDDAELLQMIEADPRPLWRLQAIRMAQSRGFKPAIGVLQRSVEKGIDDPFVERAAHEALASLRGAELPGNRQLPTVASLLAKMANDAEIVVKIDHYRLPSAAPILEVGRRVGLEITRSHVLMAGGSVSPSEWAGAHKLSLVPSVFPYELARIVGNHRLDRMLISARLHGVRRPEPVGQVHVDGMFQTRKLHKGLEALGHHAHLDGDNVTFHAPAGDIIVAPHNASGSTETEFEPMGDEVAAKLAAAVESDDAPIVMYLVDTKTVTDRLGPLGQIAIPQRIGLWVPKSKQDPIRFSADCTSANAARSLGGLIKSSLRSFEQLVSTKDGTEALDPLLEAVDAAEIVIEGTRITGSLSLADVDIEESLYAAAMSRILR